MGRAPPLTSGIRHFVEAPKSDVRLARPASF